MERNLKDCNVALCVDKRNGDTYIVVANEDDMLIKNGIIVCGTEPSNLDYVNVLKGVDIYTAIRKQKKLTATFRANHPDRKCEIMISYIPR